MNCIRNPSPARAMGCGSRRLLVTFCRPKGHVPNKVHITYTECMCMCKGMKGEEHAQCNPKCNAVKCIYLCRSGLQGGYRFGRTIS